MAARRAPAATARQVAAARTAEAAAARHRGLTRARGVAAAKTDRGVRRGRLRSHSYYDIPVFDRDGALIAAHRMDFQRRTIEADDRVAVGVVDAASGGFTRLGESRAFSWQQGPIAQFAPGTRRLVWCDRDEAGRLVARVHDLDGGATATLPRPVYALSPDGRTALSLDMDRLDALRAGYGYAGGRDAAPQRRTADDGVWALDLSGGAPELILSLDRAVQFLLGRLPLRTRLDHAPKDYAYRFNHAKIAPSGRRFTVKLRWRELDGGWNESMGVSLTVGMDGSDLALLAPATSHVIWLDDRRVYFWRQGRVRLCEDARPEGRPLSDVLPRLIFDNVHIRHLPGRPDVFVFDTPYREAIDVVLADASAGAPAVWRGSRGMTRLADSSAAISIRRPPPTDGASWSPRWPMAGGRCG